MKVQILRDIALAGTSSIRWCAGSVAEVPQNIGQDWVTRGFAVQVEPENKVVEPTETKEERKRRLTKERVAKHRAKEAQS
jgi:hypothetical protein